MKVLCFPPALLYFLKKDDMIKSTVSFKKDRLKEEQNMAALGKLDDNRKVRDGEDGWMDALFRDIDLELAERAGNGGSDQESEDKWSRFLKEA